MEMKASLPQLAYDQLADSYAEMIDKKPHNAFYDRPAVQSMIHEIVNQEILEAGCGTGIYTEWLINKGAKVVGVDANENMLRHAIDRNKENARFIKANLEEPLSFFENDRFDGIVSALTITYLKDLFSVFAEFSRVLKPKGWFVFSTEHPFFSYGHNRIDNYYETKEVSCRWKGFKTEVIMKSYYHSLGTITEALTSNGFVIEKMIEPLPLEQFKNADPNGYYQLLKFPLFIFFRAVKVI
jgi:ubiquinone/menaquinone biosynthesis C-methylase UbiE